MSTWGLELASVTFATEISTAKWSTAFTSVLRRTWSCVTHKPLTLIHLLQIRRAYWWLCLIYVAYVTVINGRCRKATYGQRHGDFEWLALWRQLASLPVSDFKNFKRFIFAANIVLFQWLIIYRQLTEKDVTNSCDHHVTLWPHPLKKLHILQKSIVFIAQ